MNYFNEYIPMIAPGRGMGLYQAMMGERDAQTQRGLHQKKMNALAAIGESPYLTGFDGMPGAETSDLRKQIYQSGDPELAVKWEAMASHPFAEDRAVKKAGEVETAKLKARAAEDEKMWGQMPNRLASILAATRGGQPISGGSNVFAQQGWAPPASTGIGMPQGEPAPGSGVMVPQRGFSDRGRALSGDGLAQYDSAQMDVTIDEHGRPQIKMKGPDSLADEVARRKSAIDAMGAETAQGELSERKTRNASMLVDESTQRIAALMQQRNDLEKSSDVLPPHKIAQGVARIDAEIALAEKRRSGAGPTEPTQLASEAQLTPAEKQKAAAVRQKQQAPGQAGGISTDLPYPAAVRMAEEQKKSDIKAAADMSADARDKAGSARGVAEYMSEMKDLLTNKRPGNAFWGFDPNPFSTGEGSTLGERIGGAVSVDNQMLAQLGTALLPLIKKPGESKAMDTIPELRINMGMIPRISNHEDVNIRLFAPLYNKWSASTVADGFLQRWKKNHGGSTDGAGDFFSDWMKYNKPMEAIEKNGKMVFKENPVVPIERWEALIKQYPAQEIRKMLHRELGIP